MPGCPPNSALKILLHVKVTIDVEHLTRDVVAIHNQVADGTSYFLGMPTGFVLIVLVRHSTTSSQKRKTGDTCMTELCECQRDMRQCIRLLDPQALTGNYP